MRLTKTTFFLGCLVGGMGAAVMPLLIPSTHAETKLLPFQGRLTDAAGSAIADGAKVVEFKLYDAPTGGNVKWAGEVHKLSINGGLVNTMLGSKASLGSVDFSSPCYLQITVDANADSLITAADPPLLPRQSVIAAVFANEAGNARKLAGNDWSSILTGGTNDPTTGTLRTDMIADGSVGNSKLSADSVQGAQILNQSVTSVKIADGTITAADLSIALQQAGLIPSGTIVAFGGVETQVPVGWLLCDGSALKSSAGIYTQLHQSIRTNWGDGSTSAVGSIYPAIASGTDRTDFNLPDLRGQFLRGVDGVAGRDPDSAASVNGGADGKRYPMATGGSLAGIGSVQNDAFQNITGSIYGSYACMVRAEPTGVFTGSILESGASVSAPSYSRSGRMDFFNFNAASSPGARTSTETRPKNAGVNYIIKL
jgi:hypothetical protein